MNDPFNVNIKRLLGRLDSMGAIGAIEGGGVCRLALSDADRLGRDALINWMRELDLQITIDAIGNIFGTRPGSQTSYDDSAAVMTGSHIDSVSTGGRYDGTLGVLAGLEVVQTLNDANIATQRPITIASFTNEEGARFAPDMLGSAVHQGSLALVEALAATDRDGASVGECLDAIGYRGDMQLPAAPPHAFVELHVEQGPVLEREGITIGAVTGVQGISWTEYTIDGVSNHAGTTPMSMRIDAGYAAAKLACCARNIALDMGGAQVATVGSVTLEPNLVNVVARRATLTVDLRNTDEVLLRQAELRMAAATEQVSESERVTVEARTLARFEPVIFAPHIVNRVEDIARELGHGVRHMPSGAGHDAQMFAPTCRAGMVFVPSENGISHNVKEFTADADIEAGANVLANLVLGLANEP